MSSYNLLALFKIREHKKLVADVNLKSATQDLQIQKKKLQEIENNLRSTVVARCKLQQDFFVKSQKTPSNKREIFVHVSSNIKNIFDEEALKKSLANQKQLVDSSALKLEVAKNMALDAHRNLKVIEKHYVSWQQQLRRQEQIKEEYINDDQNGVRFFFKKEK